MHGPMDYAKTLKLRFCVGDLDLPERRKRYTSRREEEEVDAQMCPGGRAIREGRTHRVGSCEIYDEERGVLEEKMGKIGEYDMEKYGTLDSSDKTIGILGDRRWPQTEKQEGDKMSKTFLRGKNVMSAQTLEVSLLGVETVLRLERDVVNGQMTTSSNK